MLELEIVKFDPQDVVTASCICPVGVSPQGCIHDCPADQHLCEIGES